MAELADAPYELASDRDLEDMRDQYDAMKPGESGRAELRGELAEEYARRVHLALSRVDTRAEAHEHLLALVSLWRTAELEPAGSAEVAAELAPHAGAARAIRDHFARAGGEVETTAALLFLAMAEPGQRDAHLSELAEIFAHADDLTRAQHGEGTEHARPIQILEAIVETAPIPDAVDRLIELYVIRQRAFHQHMRADGPSPGLLRAHGDSVFRTTWHVLRVLARAGRVDRAPAVVAEIDGLGAMITLRDVITTALAGDTSARRWLELVDAFADDKNRRASDEAEPRLHAILELAREGSRRFPASAELSLRAADAARQLDKLHVSIRLYEEALEREPRSRAAAEALAELYRVRVSTLAFYERPLAARARLTELEAFHAEASARWPESPLSSDLADAYAAMGRGMASLGELDHARWYLQRSLALRVTLSALEQLGTIALKQDRFAEATEHFERALKLPAAEPIDQYRRAKILRLAGEALHGGGDRVRASQRWVASIDAWMDLGTRLELPATYKGELLVETGKAQWSLGDRDAAMMAFDTAVDVDDDGADTHSLVVAFLIVRGEYGRALDAYHRALGSPRIDDYSKVYMSLWILAEARRSGRPPDPLAEDYLASRDGRLWHHDLARFATGQLDLPALERRATTRGHRAELLYYSAVLGERRDTRALLESVLSTDMILFYEYDMAKHWLATGVEPRPRAAR